MSNLLPQLIPLAVMAAGVFLALYLVRQGYGRMNWILVALGVIATISIYMNARSQTGVDAFTTLLFAYLFTAPASIGIASGTLFGVWKSKQQERDGS